MKKDQRTVLAYGVAVTALLVLILSRILGVASVDPANQVSASARYLEDAPAVVDLDQRLERVAAVELGLPAATEDLGDPSVEDAGADEWAKIRLWRDPLVRTLLHEPRQARFRSLLRHYQLNPGDQRIDKDDWLAAEQILNPIHDRIVNLAKVEAETCRSEMAAWASSGLAKGVELEVKKDGEKASLRLPDKYWNSKKDVYGVHMGGDGKGFSFALRDLPQTTGVVQMRESLAVDYLSQITTFFVERDLISNRHRATLLESFFSKSRTLR